MGKSYTDKQLERLSFGHLLELMTQFCKDVQPEDFAYLPSDPSKKTQYKRPHAPRKMKGGSAPREFQLIEDFVDLQHHLSKREYAEAIPLYYRLKRALNR